jgi:hypothetical protein
MSTDHRSTPLALGYWRATWGIRRSNSAKSCQRYMLGFE